MDEKKAIFREFLAYYLKFLGAEEAREMAIAKTEESIKDLYECDIKEMDSYHDIDD